MTFKFVPASQEELERRGVKPDTPRTPAQTQSTAPARRSTKAKPPAKE